MAGDWIKIDHGLYEKPEVHYLSSVLAIDAFTVVGMLVRVWEWFDRHTENGYAANVTFASLDRIVVRDGFAEAMNLAGWLECHDRGLRLPNFDRHNGKTAKNRALARERMSRKRYADNVTKFENVTPREEKSFKDKSSRPSQIDGVIHRRGQKTEDVKKQSPEAKAIFDEVGANLRAAYLRGSQ